MRRFERKAKLNITLVVSIVLIPLAIGAIGSFVYDIIEVSRADRCLDQGGSYDYEAKECDFETSQPGPD